MEFYQKLQELRKQKGLTQEALAETLYVSRTAVSKWESGRGYPNIESLKAIAEFFGVTIDELLSGKALRAVSGADPKKKEQRVRDLVFSFLDLGAVMLAFLPFFGQRGGDMVQSVSLLSLTGVPSYLKTAYAMAIMGMAAAGILTLALRNCERTFWVQEKNRLSLFLHTIGVFLFVISRQPYAAAFLLVFLIIKVFVAQKWS